MTPGEVQLFDVKNDPWELHNLAGSPEYAKTLAQLDGKLRNLMREIQGLLAA